MNSGVTKAMEADRNRYLFKASAKICLIIVSGVSNTQDMNDRAEESRTELDTHANMPVVGKHAMVLAETG